MDFSLQIKFLACIRSLGGEVGLDETGQAPHTHKTGLEMSKSSCTLRACMRITQDIHAKKEKKTGGIMDSHSVITVVSYNLITA